MFIIGLLLAIVGAAGGILCWSRRFGGHNPGVLCLCVPLYAFLCHRSIDGERKWIILS